MLRTIFHVNYGISRSVIANFEEFYTKIDVGDAVSGYENNLDCDHCVSESIDLVR